MAPAPDLWSFSLDLYGRPGVAAACLEAQDRFGADVNLLLWAAWIGWVHGHRLMAAEVQAAESAVAAWRAELVVPLRALRRRLKTGPAPAPSPKTDALRDQIKAAELEAERIEQQVLSRHPAAPMRSLEPAVALTVNLRVAAPSACHDFIASAFLSALASL